MVGVDDDDKLVTVPIEKLGDGPTGPIIPVDANINVDLNDEPVLEPVLPHVKYIVVPEAIAIGVDKVVNDCVLPDGIVNVADNDPFKYKVNEQVEETDDADEIPT